MTHTNRPQFSGTAVRTLADTFMVLNHFDGFIAYFHFLNACVPNQNAIMEARICISWSSKIIVTDSAKAAPDDHAHQIEEMSTTISRNTNR
jgi:hypothetical protein